jgi:hypothetical protein
MVSSILSARAVDAVVAIAGPAWSAASGCPVPSAASPAIESPPRTTPSAMAGVIMPSDVRRVRLDEFADRHFLTYLKLKEKP